MAFSDFTLDDVRRKLGLTPTLGALFPGGPVVPPPGWLTQLLARNTPLAYLSEKSRSEAIVHPVLSAAREVTGDRLAVFSGQWLAADPARGLVGDCDFILSLAEPVGPLRSPLVTVVEAKRGDIELGMGQCAAEMVAARVFNEADGIVGWPVFGCVTNGELWQFLRLDSSGLVVDNRRYHLPDLPAILGAFRAMVAAADAVSPPAP
jgi:hypothetical protein